MTRTQLFSSFINEHPNWEAEAAVSQHNDSTYKSIPRFKYYNTINVKTGEIFKGDERYEIFIKHVTLLIFRPIQLTFKTVWHASLMGPLIVELHNFLNDKQTYEQFKENNLNSLCDIIRTPIYGVAILTVHLAGIILGIFCPDTLYYTRDLVGQLERDLLRLESIHQKGPSLSPYESISPCFSPISHLMVVRDVSEENLAIYSAVNKFLEENSDSFERSLWDCPLQPPEDFTQNINTNPSNFSIEEKQKIIANLPLWFVGHFPEFLRSFLLFNQYSSLIVHNLDKKTDEEIEQLFISQQESLIIDFANPNSQTSATLRALTLPKDDPKLAIIVSKILHQAWKNILLESSENTTHAASYKGIMTHDSKAVLLDELRENANQMTATNRNIWVNEARNCTLHEKLKVYGTQPWLTIAVGLPDS